MEQVSIEKCADKTVRAVASADGRTWGGAPLYIAFTDGTFAAVEPYNDDGDLWVQDLKGANGVGLTNKQKVALGFCTAEEAEAEEARRKREKESAQEKRDREEFERLKAKFAEGAP